MEGADAVGEPSPANQPQNTHGQADSPESGNVPCCAHLTHVERSTFDVGRDVRGAVTVERTLSADVADEHHQAGQDAGRGGEADQRLNEQQHGVTPKDQALQKGCGQAC